MMIQDILTHPPLTLPVDWVVGLLATAPPLGGGNGGGAPGPGGGTGGGGQAPPGGGSGMEIIWILFGVFLLMILMQVFAGRKEKKRRQEMLGSLARHDRVQTVGGMIGTISEIKDGEVVLKIDESTNTKVRVVRSAVQQVLKKSGEASEPELASQPEKIPS